MKRKYAEMLIAVPYFNLRFDGCVDLILQCQNVKSRLCLKWLDFWSKFVFHATANLVLSVWWWCSDREQIFAVYNLKIDFTTHHYISKYLQFITRKWIFPSHTFCWPWWLTAETKDITSHKFHLEIICGTKKFGLRFTFSTKKSNSWTTAPGNSAQNPIWTDFLPVLMKCTQKEILPQSLAIFAQLLSVFSMIVRHPIIWIFFKCIHWKGQGKGLILRFWRWWS